LSAWTARTGPLYLRLADAITDAIAQGAVGAGTRLPPERALALHLAVGRGTVGAAYDTLRARRVVVTRRGSGTYVAGGAVPSALHRSPLLSNLLDPRVAPIDLSVAAAQLDGELPGTAYSLLDAARHTPAHGYAPMGIAALREAIAERITREGAATAPDEILITGGGQGAISLLASSLLRGGDRVLVEAPTYPAAIEVFARAGARIEGIARDHAGALPEELERALARGPVRLIYLIPTCHNPTGGVMSERRRHEVLSLAQRAGTTVIEDAVLTPLLLDGAAPPPLVSLDQERVYLIGSLSKTIWGGLRVGWLRAPADVVMRLGRLKVAYDLGGPALTQLAALDCFARYDELVASRRALIRVRLDALLRAVAELLPDWTFPVPRGGLCMWVALPRGSGDDLAQLALRRGVAVTPGSSAAQNDEYLGYLRLSAGPPPARIREGVERLAAAWEVMDEMPAGARSEPALTV
jgi:DNA-binding transcriptional MocR family regulator